MTYSHRSMTVLLSSYYHLWGPARDTISPQSTFSGAEEMIEKVERYTAALGAGATAGPLLIGQRNPHASCQADVTL